MAKHAMTIYLDGAETRIKNRRVGFLVKDENVIVRFRFADKNANNPACLHECLKGKVRQTMLKLTPEAMDALTVSWIEYKKSKIA